MVVAPSGRQLPASSNSKLHVHEGRKPVETVALAQIRLPSNSAVVGRDNPIPNSTGVRGAGHADAASGSGRCTLTVAECEIAVCLPADNTGLARPSVTLDLGQADPAVHAD